MENGLLVAGCEELGAEAEVFDAVLLDPAHGADFGADSALKGRKTVVAPAIVQRRREHDAPVAFDG